MEERKITWKNEYHKHVKKLLKICYWVRFSIRFFGYNVAL